METSIALGMGGMGYAIPAAIGASFLAPMLGGPWSSVGMVRS